MKSYALRFPGATRALLACRRARARWSRGVVILGYHGIRQRGDVPDPLAVSPAHFAGHLAVLAASTRPVPLGRIPGAWRDGSFPRAAVALTFDDGYADFLYAALPLLERLDIPATLFVTTGALGQEFWWDEVPRIVSAAAPGGPLVLSVGGRRVTLPAEDRTRLSRRLTRLLATRPPDERAELLDQARGWARAGAAPAPRIRALTAEEVARLAKHPLVEIGAHTESHPPLAAVPPDSRRREIHACRDRLEAVTGLPARSFSYPHGSVCRATAAEVRAAGFVRACANTNDAARPASDPWRLPRLWPADADGEAFDRWLSDWISRK